MGNDGRFSAVFLWPSCGTLGWESGALRSGSRRRLATCWRNSGRPRVWGSQGRATRWLGGYGKFSHEKLGLGGGKKPLKWKGWRILQICQDISHVPWKKSTWMTLRDHLSENFYLWISLCLWVHDITCRLGWYVSWCIFLEAESNFIMFVHFYCGWITSNLSSSPFLIVQLSRVRYIRIVGKQIFEFFFLLADWKLFTYFIILFKGVQSPTKNRVWNQWSLERKDTGTEKYVKNK